MLSGIHQTQKDRLPILTCVQSENVNSEDSESRMVADRVWGWEGMGSCWYSMLTTLGNIVSYALIC